MRRRSAPRAISASWNVGKLVAIVSAPIVSDRIAIQSATWFAIADLDPRTLRPMRIDWTRTLRFSLDGMARERVTRRQWTFTSR